MSKGTCVDSSGEECLSIDVPRDDLGMLRVVWCCERE